MKKQIVKTRDVPPGILAELLPSSNNCAVKTRYNEQLQQVEYADGKAGEAGGPIALVFAGINSSKELTHLRTVTLRWTIKAGTTNGGWRVARIDTIPVLPANYVEASRRGNTPTTVIL